MLQIRRNCFETNSSSMHSLVITTSSDIYTKEEFKEGMYINDRGELYAHYSLEFERSPFEILYTFYQKLRYFIATFCDFMYDENWYKLEDIVKKYVPEVRSISLGRTTTYLSRKKYSEDDLDNSTGVLGYFESDDGKYWEADIYDTGVNYDSEVLTSFFNKHPEITWEEFLTSKKYIIIVDGDERCIWNNLEKSGLVNMDRIDYEYGHRQCREEHYQESEE